MKHFKIAGLLLGLAAFNACDDDGDSQGNMGGQVGNVGGGGGLQGGSGGGGAGGMSGGSAFSTGVARGKKVSELTAADRTKLCMAGEAWANDVLAKGDFQKAICKFAGYFSAALSGGMSTQALRMACQDGYNECLTGEDDMDSPTDATCELPATCDITVAELETCLNDYIGTFQTAFNVFPACETLTQADLDNEDLGSEVEAIQPPPSCAAAEAKCPGLLDDEEDI